jgi:hypothetical protein
MSIPADPLIAAYLRFRAQGMRKGSSTLFTPEAALSLVDALAALGIVCLGVTGWYRPAGHPDWLAEDMGADYAVPLDVLRSPDAVAQSAEAVKAFIGARLLESHPYVEVTFDYPVEWDTLIDQAWAQADVSRHDSR